MDVVTLAHVVLLRPGSAASRGYSRNAEVRKTVEVNDSSVEGLKRVVQEMAVQHGEQRESLNGLRSVTASNYTPEAGAVVFDVENPHMQFSNAYAQCLAYPALKVGDR